MKKRQLRRLKIASLFLMSAFVATYTLAEEVIIQQEKISFEKCLKVIKTSANKLAIAPDIEDVSDQQRVAVFKLVDGTLKIKCDGEEGEVIVSTNND